MWFFFFSPADLFVFVWQTSWRWGRSPSWWHNGAGPQPHLKASLQSASTIRPQQQRPQVPVRRPAANHLLHPRRSGDGRGAGTDAPQTNQPFRKCLLSFPTPCRVRGRLCGNGPGIRTSAWTGIGRTLTRRKREMNVCSPVNICCFTHWDALTEGCAFKDRRLFFFFDWRVTRLLLF